MGRPTMREIVKRWRSTGIRVTYFVCHYGIVFLMAAHPGNDLSLDFGMGATDGVQWLPVTIYFYMILVLTSVIYFIVSFSDAGTTRQLLKVFFRRYVGYDPDLFYVGGFCHVCASPKGLRTKHCYQCGKCVMVFDHHCFWTANCVGFGNRRLFVVMLFSELHWILLVLFEIAKSLVFEPWNFFILPLLLVLPLCIYFSAFIVLLLCNHMRMMLRNETTYEHFRGHLIPPSTGRYRNNPFDSGSKLTNVVNFWWHRGGRIPTIPCSYRGRLPNLREQV